MNPEGPHPRSLPARALRATRTALAFLTVIPVRVRDGEPDPADLADSRLAYPLVGAGIGLVLASLSEGLARTTVTPPLSAFLLVAAGVVVTGGLHLDGLADTFDGIFLWGDRERRLAVLRDPHVGSYGVSAIAVALLGRFAALEALAGHGRSLAILAASVIGRTLVLVSAGSASYARPEGTGRFLVEATRPRDALAGAAAVLAIAASTAGRAGLVAGVAALALAYGLTRLGASRLGGVTGDTLGALVEMGEVTFLVVLGVF